MKRFIFRTGGPALASSLALALALASPALAAGPDFSWNADLAPGKTIHIFDINGHVTATRSPSRRASVTAVKLGRDSDFDRVRIEATPSSNGITVCALFPLKHGREMTCEDGKMHSDGETEDVKVHVEFTVEVPEGVTLDVTDVNGGIDAKDLASDLELQTVNGTINATSSGLVTAGTVNGSINAAMGKGTWERALRFKTVNGSIRLQLPHEVNADLTAASVNGSISSDFPVYVEGKFLGHSGRIGGTIGKGGGDLRIETVNGSIIISRVGGADSGSGKGKKI